MIRGRYFLVLLAGVFLLLVVAAVMSVATATDPLAAESDALRVGTLNAGAAHGGSIALRYAGHF